MSTLYAFLALFGFFGVIVALAGTWFPDRPDRTTSHPRPEPGLRPVVDPWSAALNDPEPQPWRPDGERHAA